MTREEFFEWMNTCPTHRWDIAQDEYGFVRIIFPINEEDEDD